MILPHLGPGGAQRVAAMLANAWAATGSHVFLVVLDARIENVHVFAPEVRCVPLGARFPMVPRGLRMLGVAKLVASVAVLRRIRRLRGLLRQWRPPAVLSFIAANNVMTVIACRGLGLRVVISERNDPVLQSHGAFWNLMRRWFYRHADVVTANSRGALRAMQDYVPAEKLRFLPNPVVLPSQPARCEASSSNVLSVGRLVHQKGFDILLRAFAAAAPQLNGWRLDVLGDGPLREELVCSSRKLTLNRRVEWHGYVKDPGPHYARAGIFVLASRFEGTPNALLEAMAWGLPVIVTDASPGPLELVEHERTGLVVAVGDVSALTEAILRLARDRELRDRLGRAARARVREYSVESVRAVWDDILAPGGGDCGGNGTPSLARVGGGARGAGE